MYYGIMYWFLLCGAGVVFTVSLKFVQVSKFKESFKKPLEEWV